MKQNVTIKGTKSGIILVLDPTEHFDEIRNEIADKFKEAADFFGKASMGLIVRGRNLRSEEEAEVISIIEANSKIKISCVINEASKEEKIFENVLSKAAPVKEKKAVVESADIVNAASLDQLSIVQESFDINLARIFTGNLRSGQDISCEQSVVVLGDVKPGATVTSYGNIFVLGELRGNAFAGAGGDRNAVVMALELNPLQVRIADAIAISPDAEKGPKLKFKRKKLMTTENEPEVAYIENGHIIKSLYGPSFLRQFNKN